jgi:hypothetical protein
MAQAYYLLGFGYYQLHKEALANQNTAAAEQYENNAVLYKRYYDDLMSSVDLMRKEFAIEAPTEDAPPPPMAPITPTPSPVTPAPSPSPPPLNPSTTRSVTIEQPEIVPVEQPAEPRSLLGRLKFWGNDEPEPSPEPVAPAEPKPSLGERLMFWK